LYLPLRDTLFESNLTLSNVCKLSLLSDDAELVNMDDLFIIGSMNMDDLSIIIGSMHMVFKSIGFTIVIIMDEDELRSRLEGSIFLILD